MVVQEVLIVLNKELIADVLIEELCWQDWQSKVSIKANDFELKINGFEFEETDFNQWGLFQFFASLEQQRDSSS